MVWVHAILCAALGADPVDPVVPDALLSEDRQWELLASCPRVLTRSGRHAAGTGVTIGVRGGYAYVLTADHAVPGAEEREVQFFTRDSYPLPAAKIRGVEILKRWEDPDIALLKVRLGPDPVASVPLAGIGQRPKRFPFDVLSVGCSHGAPPTLRAETVVAKKAARRPGGGLAFFWEMRTIPVPGRSGGPIVDKDGRVIGVCSAGRSGLGYYTHLDEILVALQNDAQGWLFDAPKGGTVR